MQFFNFQGQTIHYQYLPGKGERFFVFANSIGTDLRIWDEVITQLLPHGSVLRFDKPGHGLSVTGTAGDIETYAAIVLALLDAHHVERCVFIGLSIGGLMGQYLALHHPHRIEKLVLSNTASRIGGAEYWNERIEKIKAGGIPSLSGMILGRWLSPHFMQTQPDVAAGLKRMLESCDTQGYMHACQVLRDTDFSQQISAIRMPVLCIAGSLDAAIPLDDMRSLAAAVNGAQLLVLDGIGHLPCVEVPGAFADAVKAFLTA